MRALFTRRLIEERLTSKVRAAWVLDRFSRIGSNGVRYEAATASPQVSVGTFAGVLTAILNRRRAV